MDLDNQYFECVYLIFILKSFNLFFRFKKSKIKTFSKSIINSEKNKGAKKVEKSKYVAEKREDVRVQVEL